MIDVSSPWYTRPEMTGVAPPWSAPAKMTDFFFPWYVRAKMIEWDKDFLRWSVLGMIPCIKPPTGLKSDRIVSNQQRADVG